jgi:hemerythrin-like metal-binding protein
VCATQSVTYRWHQTDLGGEKMNMDDLLFIKWQECNDTGISIIDEQHRGIVSIINSFYCLTEKGMGSTMLYSIISDTVKNYSRVHFITEEHLLKAAKYPGFENHIEMHRKLMLEIELIEYVAITENDPKPLMNFLKKWWIEHINVQDMDYVPYLRNMRYDYKDLFRMTKASVRE